MRKMISFLLALCIFLLSGCKQEAPELEVPANFYYCAPEITFHNEQGVFQPEQRETKNVSEDYVALMNLYLKGPVQDHLVSPFPHGTIASAVIISDGNVKIVMNSALATLSDIHLTKACACIALTLFDLFAQADTVTIHAATLPLGEEQAITLSRQELALMDSSGMHSE